MKALKQLSQVSRYRPKANGLSDELFQLILQGQEREEVLDSWLKSGRSEDSFRHTLKKLKDGMIRESFLDNIGLDSVQRRRISCWERYQKIKSLFIADKKVAAIPLSIETVLLAQRCGFTEIVYDLSAELEHHFGAIEPDTRRYLRYRKLKKDAFKDLCKEKDTQAFFTKLVFHFRMNKGFDEFKNHIDIIKGDKEGTYKYMLYRCNTLTVWEHLHGNIDEVVKEIMFTIDYFEHSNLLAPFTVKTNLFHQLYPYLVTRGKFAEVEKRMNNVLSIPAKGSYTWHQLMLQKAYLGFHSGKPMMALDTWQRAIKKRTHNNPLIDEKWQIVWAYLVIYEKMGLLNTGKRFRMGRFKNSTVLCQQDKKECHVAILIAELIILLLDGKKKEYMERSEPIFSYTHAHLRGKDHVRSRSFLHILKKVEEGDYYMTRIKPRITRWQNQLYKNPRVVLSESEIVPYEKLWEMVCSKLK